jgi:hypothetical protein
MRNGRDGITGQFAGVDGKSVHTVGDVDGAGAPGWSGPPGDRSVEVPVDLHRSVVPREPIEELGEAVREVLHAHETAVQGRGVDIGEDTARCVPLGAVDGADGDRPTPTNHDLAHPFAAAHRASP